MTPTTGVYVPPHLNSNFQSGFSRNAATGDSRYSKDQLLDIFRAFGETEAANRNISDLFVDGWNPGTLNSTTHELWNRRDEFKDINHGPEICWDYDGSTLPLGLIELSEEEREVTAPPLLTEMRTPLIQLQLFSNSVNSPLKPPPQNGNKEGTPTSGVNGRKPSLSQIQNVGVSGNMPSGRPGPRRRDDGDTLTSANLLTSPSGQSWLAKEDNPMNTPPSLLRRRTDFKDSAFGPSLADKPKIDDRLDNALDTSSTFGPPRRTATNPLSVGASGQSSPWSAVPQSAGFPSMGAFGNFSLGTSSQAAASASADKKAGLGSLRGESRFKGLMTKETDEDRAARLRDKSSATTLEKLGEADPGQHSSLWVPNRSIRPLSAESNPFNEPEQYVGSAALGGDIPSPQAPHHFHLENRDLPKLSDDIGFSAFGAINASAFHDLMPRRDYSQQQQTPQNHRFSVSHSQEPMSPTSTNPYQSPETDKVAPDKPDMDDLGAPDSHQASYSMGGNPPRAFNMNYEGEASDRSQTSSIGASRPLPTLGSLGGGMGGLGTWSAASGAAGAPFRTNPGFTSGKDSIFGSLGDLPPSNQAGGTALGHSSVSGFGGIGAIGRGSKMGSLFPAAMQDQMRVPDLSRPEQGYRDQQISGAENAPGLGAPTRDTESPSHQGRGMLDDLFGSIDNRSRGVPGLGSHFGANEAIPNVFSQAPHHTAFSAASTLANTASIAAPSAATLFGRADPDATSGAANQMPAAQQRQMVMPDRMRWIYRDPQGNIQGPFSGLEMHDWYKAGFFSPELQVKKLEDADYEPLAQLIRRIGNSREPFLVPQIGIPHGPASTQPGSNSLILGSVPAASPGAQPGPAQPPFPNSFPQFGTTLTAEQQNALERRKQEEQYLMARQKEHLAQQQVMIKQRQHMQGVPLGMHSQQLHHHSSAHSLHSQPSYGSITSPTGYQPSPGQGPIQHSGVVPGFYDAPTRSTVPGMAPLGLPPGPDGMQPGRDIDHASTLDRLNMNRVSQLPFGGQIHAVGQHESFTNQQQVATMLQDRARLQREQEQADQLHQGAVGDTQESVQRLEQFKQLRLQTDDQAQGHYRHIVGQPIAARKQDTGDQTGNQHFVSGAVLDQDLIVQPAVKQEQSHASEHAVSPPAKPTTAAQPQSPWATIETLLPQAFPPPSTTPLPAPAAQRTRQNVADALAVDSRSRSQTPSVDTPAASLAPWAKDMAEGSKGPSLKEIQEAEARKTAQQELAAAARRILAEQERQNEMQAVPTAAGLPSTANWASGGSPATPTSGGGPSAWAKPLAGKSSSVAVPATGAKRTLAQIQKEEEARKTRAATAAAAHTANALAGVPHLPGGKRYADLASKVAAAPTAAAGSSGAWTTVGAGGRLKMPVASSHPVPAVAPRAPSSTHVAAATGKAKSTSLATIRNTTTSGSSLLLNGPTANDEFHKWAKAALGKGLNASINGQSSSFIFIFISPLAPHRPLFPSCEKNSLWTLA